VIGAVLVGLVAVTALVSLVWTPFDPEHAGAERLLSPGAEHWLGTDRFGRDVFSQVMAGARITLLVGLVAVGIAAVVGVPLGVLAGMRGGRLGALLMRGSDILLAFPGLLLAIVLGAVYGAGTVTAMIALGIGSIPAFARVARSGTLQVMRSDYVVAARAANRGDRRTARAAQHRGHRAGAVLRELRDRRARRGRAVLPRPGHAPADAVVGPHAAGVAAVPRRRRPPRDRARRRHRRGGARVQPAG
jgi:ABC-type Fe3+ transport system permease subunit